MAKTEAEMVRRVLTTAKALIADPSKWLKGAHKHDDCYCSLGAVSEAAKTLESSAVVADALYVPARDALADAMFCGGDAHGSYDVITSFNDEPARTHEEVMSAFDRAIAASGEETGHE
jgi:hypothetical protein